MDMGTDSMSERLGVGSWELGVAVDVELLGTFVVWRACPAGERLGMAHTAVPGWQGRVGR